MKSKFPRILTLSLIGMMSYISISKGQETNKLQSTSVKQFIIDYAQKNKTAVLVSLKNLNVLDNKISIKASSDKNAIFMLRENGFLVNEYQGKYFLSEDFSKAWQGVSPQIEKYEGWTHLVSQVAFSENPTNQCLAASGFDASTLQFLQQEFKTDLSLTDGSGDLEFYITKKADQLCIPVQLVQELRVYLDGDKRVHTYPIDVISINPSSEQQLVSTPPLKEEPRAVETKTKDFINDAFAAKNRLKGLRLSPNQKELNISTFLKDSKSESLYTDKLLDGLVIEKFDSTGQSDLDAQEIEKNLERIVFSQWNTLTKEGKTIYFLSRSQGENLNASLVKIEKLVDFLATTRKTFSSHFTRLAIDDMAFPIYLRRWKTLNAVEKQFVKSFLVGEESEQISKRLEQENGRVSVAFEGYLGLYHPRTSRTGFGTFGPPYYFVLDEIPHN